MSFKSTYRRVSPGRARLLQPSNAARAETPLVIVLENLIDPQRAIPSAPVQPSGARRNATSHRARGGWLLRWLCPTRDPEGDARNRQYYCMAELRMCRAHRLGGRGRDAHASADSSPASRRSARSSAWRSCPRPDARVETARYTGFDFVENSEIPLPGGIADRNFLSEKPLTLAMPHQARKERIMS